MVLGNQVNSRSFNKLIETDRYIIGGSGAAGLTRRVMEWVAQGFTHPSVEEPTVPYMHNEEEPVYDVAFIDKLNGKLFIVEGYSFDILEVEYPHAIGSGCQYAIGFLEGKSFKTKNLACKAVEVASKYDIYTGGNITFVDVVLLDSDEYEEEYEDSES